MAKTFTVTLSDGTQLTELELNGNNFVSTSEITAGTFDGKLRHVAISCSDENFRDRYGLVGEHDNMELINLQHYDAEQAAKYGIKEGWYFALRELTPEEIYKISTDARISYLEMITEA